MGRLALDSDEPQTVARSQHLLEDRDDVLGRNQLGDFTRDVPIDGLELRLEPAPSLESGGLFGAELDLVERLALPFERVDLLSDRLGEMLRPLDLGLCGLDQQTVEREDEDRGHTDAQDGSLTDGEGLKLLVEPMEFAEDVLSNALQDSSSSP